MMSNISSRNDSLPFSQLSNTEFQDIVAKAETVYLPVRTKCVTFVTTPFGVVVVVCV